MTQSGSTLQKRAIFPRNSGPTGISLRQTRISGWMPMESSSFTLCWVGLDLSSPAACRYGISVTWINALFSAPTLQRI